MATNWGTLKVVDLKGELKRRGLPQAGRKEELVKRLVEADAEAEADASADEANVDDDIPAQSVQPMPSAEAVREPTPEAVVSPPREASPMADQPNGQPAPPLEGEASAPSVSAVKNDEPAITKASLPHESPSRPSSQKNTLVDLARVPSAEVVQDVLKRKRRSQSPPPSNPDTPRKRLRTDGQPAEGHADIAMSNADHPAQPAENKPPPPASQAAQESTQVAPRAKEDTFASQEEALDYGEGASARVHGHEAPRELSQPSEDLVSRDPPQLDGARAESPAIPEDEHLLDTERGFEPSLHSRTSALYIAGLMRPLRAPMVEEHLIELAMAPKLSPDPSLIQTFYLDQIRTHAFVEFRSVSAASRARAALHGRVWPDERNRKALWVDFIPPDKIQDWIEKEQSGGGGRSALKKWEVVYEDEGDGVVARLQQGSDTKPPRPPAATADKPAIPTGPSRAFPGIEAAPSGPKGFVHPSRLGNVPIARTSGDSGGSRTTRAGPPLLYQPASEELARRRIDNLHSWFARDPGRDLGRENNRYTFESGDSFVDRGKEVFEGIRPPHREHERRRNAGGPPPFRPPRGRHGGGRSRRDDYRPPPRSSEYRPDRPPYRDNNRDRW